MLLPMTTIDLVDSPTTLPGVTPEELEHAREEGRALARVLLKDAPQHPLLRIAWAQGVADIDLVRTTVSEARGLGIPWPRIAEITGDSSAKVAENKWGGGRERDRAYRERRRAEKAARKPRGS